jgi:hypothetical protein
MKVRDSLRIDETKILNAPDSSIDVVKGALMKTYHVQLTFTEPMLGTAPSNPTVYKDHIVLRKFKDLKKVATGDDLAKLEKEEDTLAAEEAALLPAEDKGVTVFRRYDVATKEAGKSGLILLDYMGKGFLKEAGEAMGIDEKSVWGLRSKLDKWLFIGKFEGRKFKADRYLPIMRDGKQVMEPDGVLERPLRAMTMQGPRVTLAASEYVNAGASLSFHITILPLAETAKVKITEEAIKEWVEILGQLCGLGQWRSGGYGRFEAVVTSVK